MNQTNYQDVFDQLLSHQFNVTHLNVDGKMHRVKREGNDQKGWYVLHDFTNEAGQSAIIGSFGYFEGPESFKYPISPGKGVTLSAEEKAAMRARHKENAKRAAAQEKARHERASKQATAAWAKYVPDGESDYLKRKGVEPHGLRFSPSGNGTVAIPMQLVTGQIMGLQIIRGKNRRAGQLEKECWPKGHTSKGAFYLIGGSQSPVILITEGYATGATLYEATNIPVAVAFFAGNLQPVAIALHEKYPFANLLFCADDDYLVQCKQKLNGDHKCNHYNLAGAENCEACGNPLRHKGRAGEQRAKTAALAVGGDYLLPQFPTDRQRKKLTDFNDLANYPSCSLSTVREQVEQKLKSLGWHALIKQQGGKPKQGRGEGFVYQPALSVMDIDALVDRFIPIDDGNGKLVFDTRTNKLVHKDQMLALMPAKSKFEEIKSHWQWIQRGSYYLDEVGFDPTEQDSSVKLNLWTGWQMAPKQGECNHLLDIIEHLVSGEENSDDLLEWLLKWMAYPLQHPGAKMASAVILHGPQGTGKSLVFKTLARIYGRYAAVIGNSGIEDKFNADWSDSKLFILAEEIATSADKWQIKNELKELITGESIRVRGMYSNAYHQKNHMNVAFLSNEKLPVPIEHDDRRHCVIYTPPKMPKGKYTQALEQLDNGGVEAFYWFLMHDIDTSDFHRHVPPPMSRAKQNLIDLSLPSEQKFIKLWTTGELDLPICPCTTQSLYDAYKFWCNQTGERFRSQKEINGELKLKPHWQVKRERIYQGCDYKKDRQVTLCIMPEMLMDKEKKQKPNRETKIWLTDCIMAFDEAVTKQKEATA